MIPRRAGVIPKTAWSEAIRISHATAISSPPPKANPFSIAITGEGNDSIARIMASNGLLERSTWASPLPPPDEATRALFGEADQRRPQLVQDLQVQRVLLRGVGEGDGRHPPVALDD